MENEDDTSRSHKRYHTCESLSLCNLIHSYLLSNYFMVLNLQTPDPSPIPVNGDNSTLTGIDAQFLRLNPSVVRFFLLKLQCKTKFRLKDKYN